VNENDEGKQVVSDRNGEIALLDDQGPRAREVRRFRPVRCCKVEEGQEVKPGDVLCEWDPHRFPILAEVGGKVRFEDIVEGETMRIEKDPGNVRR
jgi:DNA-directed RNA polymerase subunit beta'